MDPQREHYARICREYLGARTDTLCHRIYSIQWQERLFALVPPLPEGARFLDPMCGSGDLAAAAGARYHTAVGLDLSPEMLGAARIPPNGATARLVAGDVRALPFPEKSYDVVMIRGSLHHVHSDFRRALAEVSRVLRPGGFLVLSEPVDDHPLIRMIRAVVYRASPLFGPGERAFRTRHLLAALGEAGFQVRQAKPFGYVAYALIGNTDVLPLLRSLRRMPLIRGLIRLDEVMASLPVLRGLHFAVEILAQRRTIPGGAAPLRGRGGAA